MKSPSIGQSQARRIWLRAQRLDTPAPFGAGPAATVAAVSQLGYVQIDTINVIERSHHHILHTRIPGYRRADLQRAQTIDKTVFEYWTHALSYVPASDLRFFLKAMRRFRAAPSVWFKSVTPQDLRKVVARIRREGPISIRDIDDDVLVEKAHLWASRKPSKRALQLAFLSGLLTISARSGMVKTYELFDRHFGWPARPKPASDREICDYLLDRALRSQGLVSLDSICHLNAKAKPILHSLIKSRVRRKELAQVDLDWAGPGVRHWMRPEWLDPIAQAGETVHLLSPFDPLVIQRKRLQLFFGYLHRFEAYVPKEKRQFGYFALPVLIGDEIVAAIDLKTDRVQRKLLVQQWTWFGRGAPRSHKKSVEEALHRFEHFQLAA